MRDYLKTFEKVYVIVPSNRVSDVRKYIPKSCGIISYRVMENKEVIFSYKKKAQKNVCKIEQCIESLSSNDLSQMLKLVGKDDHQTRSEKIIQFIEDRYKVVEALKQVVFDYTDYANERDHVQKIVEQHYWLFGEQYNLVTADQRMQKALANYLNILYGSDAPDATLNPDQEEMRRMDIFLCGARKTEDSVGDEIQENLVIELKAPKVVLTKKVLRQIEDYMDFVRKQPQFNTQLCRWRFIAVCNNVDDDVRARYATNQTKGKKGLVFSVENYELYALTWADVFKSFELRHSFLLKKLKIDQEAIEKDISQQLGNSTGREAVNNLTALALPVSMISG